MCEENLATKQRIKLEDNLCFSIYKTSHALNRFFKPRLKELGLTYPQYLVILALLDKDRQTVTNLGKLLFLESSTLTPLLKRLETSGFILRQRSSKDERQVIISLREKGRQLSDGICRIQACALEALDMDLDTANALILQMNELRTVLTEET